MTYTIKVRYQTGNSFDSWEETDEIGWSWDDVETAREALTRLHKHYKWYQDHRSSFREAGPRPDFVGRDETKSDHLGEDSAFVQLPTDDGGTRTIYPMYIGYFERPIEAWIELDGAKVRF